MTHIRFVGLKNYYKIGVKEMDILEKYNLTNKGKELYKRKKGSSGPTDNTYLYQCFSNVLSDEWRKRRDALNELQDIKCENMNLFNDPVHCKCYILNICDKNICNECQYYVEKLKTLESERDELKKEAKKYEEKAKYICFSDQ